MVRMSVLGDALKTLSNAEKRGKRQVMLRPSSKVVIKFLQIMQKHGTFAALWDSFILLRAVTGGMARGRAAPEAFARPRPVLHLCGLHVPTT